MSKCMKCGRELTLDEKALHCKLINRGSAEFMCIDCLAAHFKTDTQKLRGLIERFRNDGCMLFK